MTELPVKPHRKTLHQTAIILNVSIKTIRRYLDGGKLLWAGGNQVSVESIVIFLQTPLEDESIEEVEAKINTVMLKSKGRRIISSGI